MAFPSKLAMNRASYGLALGGPMLRQLTRFAGNAVVMLALGHFDSPPACDDSVPGDAALQHDCTVHDD